MKKYITNTVEKTYDVVDEIICNCCGELIPDFKEHLSLHKEFGYFTEVFNDGDEYDFEVCEKCLKKWFDSFTISPLENNE